MTSSERADLRLQLIRHEGLRLRPYIDTVGKTSIGVGRNLTDNGISTDEAMLLLDHDIDDALAEVTRALPWALELDPVRLRAVLDLEFNMGTTRLLGFKNMLAALKRRDFPTAASHLLQSKMAKQTGRRAVTLAAMMELGSDV